LQADPDDEVIRLVRLRRARGNSIAKLTNCLPMRVGEFTADSLTRHGLYELMRARGIQLHAADQTHRRAQPQRPKPAISTNLATPPCSPCSG